MSKPSFVEPSQKELDKVAVLRKQVDEANWEHKLTDVTLLRYLRGHKGDSDKAFEYLGKHIQYRLDEQIDTGGLTAELVSRQIESKKAIVSGRDKQDRPICFIMVRRHDANNRDLDEMKKFVIYTYEELLRQANAKHEQITLVFDMHQFGMGCMDYEVVKYLISTMQLNYPDALGTFCILNAPFVFYACWVVIAPWLDPVTSAKVNFCSSKQLRDVIDENQIIEDVKH
jgi:hypothetical protein